MTPEQRHRAHITALALGQNSKARNIRAKFTPNDCKTARMYLHATTAIALEYRLGALEASDPLDLAELGRFTAELRSAYRHAEPPVNVLDCEAVIRALYGESFLLDEMAEPDIHTAMQCVLRALVDSDTTIRDNLDEIITRAQQLMLAWIVGPSPEPTKHRSR